MNLRSRIEMLEKRLVSKPIVLLMPDGNTEIIAARGKYMLHLFSRACRGERTPEMELIARSVSSLEPDGAHMVSVLRALLNGPVKTRTPA